MTFLLSSWTVAEQSAREQSVGYCDVFLDNWPWKRGHQNRTESVNNRLMGTALIDEALEARGYGG